MTGFGSASKSPSLSLLKVNVLNTVLASSADGQKAHAYTVYGFLGVRTGCVAFNGEMLESVKSLYLLGLGYRGYDPITMRFHSPDLWSPFGAGGINCYAYCGGAPVNGSDPTGHINPMMQKKFLGQVRYRNKVLPQGRRRASLVSVLAGSMDDYDLVGFKGVKTESNLESMVKFGVDESRLGALYRAGKALYYAADKRIASQYGYATAIEFDADASTGHANANIVGVFMKKHRRLGVDYNFGQYALDSVEYRAEPPIWRFMRFLPISEVRGTVARTRPYEAPF